MVPNSTVQTMARPARLTTDEILDLALPVFWRRGFEGSTLPDLEDAIGLGRQSLYNHYTDKRALFLAVLQRYEEYTDAALAPLRASVAGLDTIVQFFSGGRAKQREVRSGGCMIAKLAADLPEEKAIRS